MAKNSAQADQTAAEQPEAVQEVQTDGGAENATSDPQGGGEVATVQYVYVGPTLPNGRLKGNAVFEGESLEKILEFFGDLSETHPQIKRLFVPVDKLGENLVKVKTPGNLLHKYYHDIASAIMHGATVVTAKEE